MTSVAFIEEKERNLGAEEAKKGRRTRSTQGGGEMGAPNPYQTVDGG